MRRPLMPWAAVFMLLVGVPGASAHSLDELQTDLYGREKFFQTIDKPGPAFSLVDAGGEKITLEVLRDQVVVLHFIYTSCPDVCPLHAEKIAEVQKMVNQTPMKERVRFISITTDPGRDTPQVLADYGPAHGLDASNWSFLTVPPGQPEDTTRRLAKAFGHEFTQTKDGYQVHGVVTHVIDRNGRWRANFHGMRFEPVNLVLFINALVNDVQSPHDHSPKSVWDRLKELF
jgi:protein SCO1/2